jgi:hypothetical protein
VWSQGFLWRDLLNSGGEDPVCRPCRQHGRKVFPIALVCVTFSVVEPEPEFIALAEPEPGVPIVNKSKMIGQLSWETLLLRILKSQDLDNFFVVEKLCLILSVSRTGT